MRNCYGDGRITFVQKQGGGRRICLTEHGHKNGHFVSLVYALLLGKSENVYCITCNGQYCSDLGRIIG